jgi:hypothetical protein
MFGQKKSTQINPNQPKSTQINPKSTQNQPTLKIKINPNQPKSTQINPNQPKINPKSTPLFQNQPKSTQINPNQPKINPPVIFRSLFNAVVQCSVRLCTICVKALTLVSNLQQKPKANRSDWVLFGFMQQFRCKHSCISVTVKALVG